MIDEWIVADNSSLTGLDLKGATLAMHLYRGNNRGSWFGEGSYAPIAEKFFNSIPVDRVLSSGESGHQLAVWLRHFFQGNPLTWKEQQRQLELVAETARRAGVNPTFQQPAPFQEVITAPGARVSAVISM